MIHSGDSKLLMWPFFPAPPSRHRLHPRVWRQLPDAGQGLPCNCRNPGVKDMDPRTKGSKKKTPWPGTRTRA